MCSIVLQCETVEHKPKARGLNVAWHHDIILCGPPELIMQMSILNVYLKSL